MTRISQLSLIRPGRDEPLATVPVWSPQSVAVLGGERDAHGLPIPIAPSSRTVFGPRGCCLIGREGPLWVADSGHHRLLGWEQRPRQDGVPADWIIGQPDFISEGRNAKTEVGLKTCNVPTGIRGYLEGMVVADAWNHRVLIWHRLPQASHCAPDLVLGQADFTSNEINRGGPSPSAETLYWPYGVATSGQTLLVADTGNRRVLIWHTPPERNGQPADLVLGQHRFDRREENAGGAPTAMSMRWPHGITCWGERLCVADAGNNRIMIWPAIPAASAAPCHWILGQANGTHVDHNSGDYWPWAGSLNMPYDVAACGSWLIVADTANSRVLAWHETDLGTGTRARGLAGQPTFQHKGDNQWGLASRETLCWPYGLSVCDGILAVADSGNNRVLIGSLSPDLMS